MEQGSDAWLAARVGVLTGASLPPFVTQSWRDVYKVGYHTLYGMPSDFEIGMNTGVLAYSPRQIAPLFGRVYDEYEDRGGEYLALRAKAVVVAHF